MEGGEGKRLRSPWRRIPQAAKKRGRKVGPWAWCPPKAFEVSLAVVYARLL